MLEYPAPRKPPRNQLTEAAILCAVVQVVWFFPAWIVLSLLRTGAARNAAIDTAVDGVIYLPALVALTFSGLALPHLKAESRSGLTFAFLLAAGFLSWGLWSWCQNVGFHPTGNWDGFWF